MSDQRARRRAAAEASKSKVDIVGMVKRVWIPLAILAVASSVTAYQSTTYQDGPSCPGHWHSVVEFWVDGERVVFPQPPYSIEAGRLPMRTHLHNRDDATWHWEPSTRTCVDFKEPLKLVDTTLTSDSLVLDGVQSITGTFTTNETHELRAYSEPYGGSFREVSPGSVANRQLGDGERVLIIYGPSGDEAFDAQRMEAMTPLGDSWRPAPIQFPFVPVMMTWIFSAVAIAVWNKFRSVN